MKIQLLSEREEEQRAMTREIPKNAGRIPSLQFYVGDWLSDPELRSCSVAARGLFIDLMCLMHRSKVYGKLLINGSRAEDKQVINLLRIHHKTYYKSLKELLDYGVVKQDEDGVYYNARMMRDKALRDKAVEDGKLGGNPVLTGGGVNPKDNPKVNGGVKPSSSSPSPSSSDNNVNDDDKRNGRPRKRRREPIRDEMKLKDEFWRLQEKFGFPNSEEKPICWLLSHYPQQAINEAVMALRDAIDSEQPLRNKAAYFTQVVKYEPSPT